MIFDLVRASLTSLRRSPGTVLIAFALLLIGTTSVLVSVSILDEVNRGGFRLENLDRLKTVWAMRSNGQQQRLGWKDFETWSKESRSFEWMAAMDPVSVSVERGDAVVQTSAARISGNLLSRGGARLIAGRSFQQADEDAGSDVVVVSEALSQDLFGSVSIGRDITIDGRMYAIIGVVDEFTLPSAETAIWLPAWTDPEWNEVRERGGIDSWYVIGLLSAESSEAAAAEELYTLASGTTVADDEIRFVIDPLAWLTAPPRIRRAAVVVFAAALVLLLISSANVAKLLHVRIRRRWSALAVRLAVGASPLRLVLQLLIESLVVAATAGVVSVAIAPFLIRWIATNWPELPLTDSAPSPLVATLAILAGLAAAMAGASIPALAMRRIRLGEVLQGQTRMSTASRAIDVLATLQIALAVLLLGAGGLLLRSGWRMIEVDPGYTADSVVMIQLSLPRERSEADRSLFHRSLLESMQALPGVDGAAVIEDFFTREGRSQTIHIEDGSSIVLPISLDGVSPSFFRTMQIPLVEGRSFERNDDERSTAVAIVNRTMERLLGGDVLNRRIRIGDSEQWLTVVGVVGDARRVGREREAIAQLFRPIAQRPSRNVNLLIRTANGDDTVLQATRSLVASLDPGVPLYGATTLRQAEARTSRWRWALLGTLASLALTGILLAAIATWALNRERLLARNLEIVIRSSLGADPASIARLLLIDLGRRAVAGIALGTAAWLLAGQLMRPILFETRPFEPGILAGTITVTLLLVIGPSLPSILQATHINLSTAFRAN